MGIEMKEHIQIAKDLVKGALLGLNTYIKPGGLHRLIPNRVVDEIACNLIVSFDHIVESIKLGEMIREGEISATGVDYGRVYASALRDLYRECNSTHPQYVIPLMVLGFSIKLAEVESIIQESSKFKRALETINAVNKWGDLKQFIETLKTIGREDMYNHLQSTGYTQIALLKSGISFNDLFRVLSSKWRGFLLIDSRETALFSYLKRIVDLNKEYKNPESALIAFYTELIRTHIPSSLQDKVKKIEECKYSTTAECLKNMYELDTHLRKSGYSFDWASEITILISALNSFET